MINRNDIIDAMGRIPDDMIENVESLREKKNKRPLRRKWLTLVACLLLILGIGITVEATTGKVSELFAPLFQEKDKNLVNTLGTPIGESISIGEEYTLTADAVIGDKHHMIVTYTLTRNDRKPIDPNINFENWHNEIHTTGTMRGSTTFYSMKDPNNPRKLYFIEHHKSCGTMVGNKSTVEFTNLITRDSNGEKTTLASGTWKFEFTLNYKDTTVQVPVHNFTVKDENGHPFTITDIDLSPIGISISATTPIHSYYEDGVTKHFTASILLKDGSNEYLMGGGGYHYEDDNDFYNVFYYDIFGHPIPLSDMEAIVICGTKYPINLKD